ncbi:MAG: helix-turn-helix domain-containing protein [Leptolyngbyaceae cyanobacterium]
MENKHIGSSFDDFLAEEEILEEVSASAWKRVLAWQIEVAMAEKHLNKTQMAAAMQTSRSALNRLLDPGNPSLNLKTLEKAAKAVGKSICLSLE